MISWRSGCPELSLHTETARCELQLRLHPSRAAAALPSGVLLLSESRRLASGLSDQPGRVGDTGCSEISSESTRLIKDPPEPTPPEGFTQGHPQAGQGTEGGGGGQPGGQGSGSACWECQDHFHPHTKAHPTDKGTCRHGTGRWMNTAIWMPCDIQLSFIHFMACASKPAICR